MEIEVRLDQDLENLVIVDSSASIRQETIGEFVLCLFVAFYIVLRKTVLEGLKSQ